MKKWLLFLLFCVLSLDSYAQQIVSERQGSWGFVSFVTKITIIITAICAIVFGSISLIAYRNELTIVNFLAFFNTSNKKSKSKKKKRRHRRSSSQSEAEQQAEAEATAQQQAEAQKQATLQQEAEEKHQKSHRSSRYKTKKTSRFEKNKKTYRTLFVISALIFFGAFFLYLLAEREKSRDDAPYVIPPEFMW